MREVASWKPIDVLYRISSPRYLCDLITVQPSRSTRSSALVTLLQPSVDSSLKITDRSYRYAAPYLWNKLPPTRVPYQFDPLSSPSSSLRHTLMDRLLTFIVALSILVFLSFFLSLPLSFFFFSKSSSLYSRLPRSSG